MKHLAKILLCLLLVFPAIKTTAQDAPLLLLSNDDAQGIQQQLESNPLLSTSYAEIKAAADNALATVMDVPVPKDNGGGYTHEKHKQNYRDMYAAAIAYKISGDKKYAAFTEAMLLKYATLYPKLPLHPFAPKNQFAGRLFWQSLNDYVWLVYTIQAYDLVRDNIPLKNRKTVERDVFRSMAKFISEGENGLKMFNIIHNHGTWALAAVGMTGYVLHDSDMVARALYGSKKDKASGFIKQLDALFSPDGYYSEGPYYERYALHPFMLFAQAIENNQPELHIFKYRDGILGKAVHTMFCLTYDSGRILPFNDALKEKDITSEELVAAADIAYANYKDETLLPVIKKQGVVTFTGAGLEAALASGESTGSLYASAPGIISDGPDGKSGGVALLRDNGSQLSLVFKYTTQGMNHGHFDRLGIQLYHNGHEVLPDYGAVRFINIEAKNGGRYLKENDTYAKQSIAHSTLVADEASHYNGKWEEAQKYSPQQLFADVSNPEIQIAAAQDTTAYAGITLQRIEAVITGDTPFVIDIFKVTSKEKHRYDLNFMYSGQVMETSFKYTQEQTLNPLGSANGYQHIWKVAEGQANKGLSQFTWLNDKTFYTISTLTDGDEKAIFTRAGANDPDFNLRPETGYLLRTDDAANKTFVSVIEPHGSFEAVPELVNKSHSGVTGIQLLADDAKYTVVSVDKDGRHYTVLLAFDGTGQTINTLILGGRAYQWFGNYKLIKD